MKRFTLLLTCLTAFASAIPGTLSAQTVNTAPPITKQLPGSPATQRTEPVEKLFPAMRALPLQHRSTLLSIKGQKPRLAQSRPAGTTLKAGGYVPTAYGVLTASSAYDDESLPAIASLPLQSPVTPTAIGSRSSYAPTYGATLADGKLTGVYYNSTYATYGLIFESIVTFDVSTGEMLSQEDTDNRELLAIETATDPTDGSVFGEFFNASLSGMQYGVVDYAAKTRTTISNTTKTMAAIGISNDGQAYGIATDGNLYKISRATGEETLVGPTGVTIEKKSGSYYGQSGEIDPKTNTFYWAAIDSAGTSGIYTVDLQSGHATLIDNCNLQFYSMSIPAPAAEDGAPAAATGLTATFTGHNTTGTVTFTAPTATFAGNALSGNLSYTITANGTQIATGTTTAGATVTRDVTVPEGENTIQVTTANAVGTSPAASIKTYAGYDQPTPPANVRLTVAGDKQATITWEASTGAVHNGYLGPITYNVYRYTNTDTVKVAEGLTTLTYTEALPERGRTTFSYGVRAVNTSQMSTAAVSNGETIGTAYDVPYLEEFNDKSSLNDFTIIDANDDKTTWEWDDEGCAHYRYSSSNNADDWLITPQINMKAGKSYNVTFKARAQGTNYPEKIEVKYGTDSTVAALNSTVLEPTVIGERTYRTYTSEIIPGADGKYNIGFHAISDKNMFYLYLDSIAVTVAADLEAPDSVTALTAATDPTGALNVNLSFRAPSTDISGAAITAPLDSIVVANGSTVVATFKDVQAGSAQSVTDSHAARGINDYTVTAYNSHGAGRKATVSVYAGEDIPEAPEVSTTDNITNVLLAWPNVDGVNGGLIIPENVNYDIYDINDDNTLGDKVTTVKGMNTYTVNLNTTLGEQKYKQWAVRAVNAGGTSQWGVGSILVGAPYTLPFANSLAGGTLENQFMGLIASSEAVVWNITTADSYDNDGGGLVFTNAYYYSSYAGQATITTGKISLTGSQNPKLFFNYKAAPGSDAGLVAEIEHKDGSVEQVWSADFKSATASGWQQAIIDLPASVKSEPYSIVRFRGVANSNTGVQVYLDNIHVADPYQNDAAIAVTAPESLKKGQTASIVATLSNQGLDNLSNLEVKLTVNDEVVADTVIAKSLATFDKVEIPVVYKTSSLMDAGTLTVKAEVVNASDLDESNNTATANVALTQASVNAPTGLSGTPAADSVTLSWTAPEATTETVNEDFESYTPWITDGVGGWTFVNADGGIFGSVANGAEPNASASAAYEVWHPNGVFAPNDALNPHSGEQCLTSMYKMNSGGTSYIDADDWLISPELSGQAQTVTFWVNNASNQGTGSETFQVLASQTDKQTGSFTQIGNDYTQSNGTWTKISVNLPAGSRYFAIRRTTPGNDALIFFVDDITYESGTSVVSYNVYIDGKLVGNTAGTSFTAGPGDTDSHTYSVTAVYTDGSESQPVSIDFVVNAIDNIPADLQADRYNVFTLSGAQVKLGAKDLRGIPTGVYIINGKKVLVK